MNFISNLKFQDPNTRYSNSRGFTPSYSSKLKESSKVRLAPSYQNTCLKPLLWNASWNNGEKRRDIRYFVWSNFQCVSVSLQEIKKRAGWRQSFWNIPKAQIQMKHWLTNIILLHQYFQQSFFLCRIIISECWSFYIIS